MTNWLIFSIHVSNLILKMTSLFEYTVVRRYMYMHVHCAK